MDQHHVSENKYFKCFFYCFVYHLHTQYVPLPGQQVLRVASPCCTRWSSWRSSPTTGPWPGPARFRPSTTTTTCSPSWTRRQSLSLPRTSARQVSSRSTTRGRFRRTAITPARRALNWRCRQPPTGRMSPQISLSAVLSSQKGVSHVPPWSPPSSSHRPSPSTPAAFTGE